MVAIPLHLGKIDGDCIPFSFFQLSGYPIAFKNLVVFDHFPADFSFHGCESAAFFPRPAGNGFNAGTRSVSWPGSRLPGGLDVFGVP